ncbi:serine hydrolase [Rheinheimera sp.]|uniref:serine hydrolase domain-containing protein n=1 Tax=Rheinheimera sp. TaxID=1869214 RepID=UPI0027B9282B|nr:serine hydrolase domain-containing protein [Rheinheimera sp.]
MKHTLTLLTTALCLSLTSPATLAFSNTELQQKMQTLVVQKAKADQPGFTVLVRKGDQVMLRGGYGMANLELAVPMQANSNLRLASQTKQFTAMAVLQLVHAGKISLQHKVGEVLKDYPAVGRDISIHQLLTHSSGIPNLSRMPEFKQNKSKDATLAEMLALFNDKPLQFAPGSRFMYSNSNYVLLTAIIEAVSKQSYADYLQQHIFQPLGMKNTGYDSATAIIPNRASGYEQQGNTFLNAAVISMTRPQGAGALRSTVDDMNLWDQALYSNKLVPQALLQQSFIKHPSTDGQPQPYGYGWMMADLAQLPTQEHSGGIEGFSSYIIRIPAQQVYVVVLANSSYFDSYTLAVKLAAIAIGKPIEPVAVELSAEAKQAIVGNYSFDDGTERHISLHQGELLCQTLDGPTQKLIPTAEGKLYLEDDISYLTLGDIKAGKAELALVIRGFGTFPAKRLQ